MFVVAGDGTQRCPQGLEAGGSMNRCAGLLVIGFVSAACAVTITVDTTVKYQTVEGLGAFANISPWKVRSGPFYVDVNLDAIGF